MAPNKAAFFALFSLTVGGVAGGFTAFSRFSSLQGGNTGWAVWGFFGAHFFAAALPCGAPGAGWVATLWVGAGWVGMGTLWEGAGWVATLWAGAGWAGGTSPLVAGTVGTDCVVVSGSFLVVFPASFLIVVLPVGFPFSFFFTDFFPLRLAGFLEAIVLLLLLFKGGCYCLCCRLTMHWTRVGKDWLIRLWASQRWDRGMCSANLLLRCHRHWHRSCSSKADLGHSCGHQHH